MEHLINFGYTAVFLGIFLEDFGIPSPGEALLVGASVLAAKGQLNIFFIAITAVGAAFLGDNVGYAIGRFGGRRVVLKFGKYVFLTQRRLAKVEKFFARYGAEIVVLARFVEGLRQFNGLAAGIGAMKWPRFMIFNLTGSVLWVGFWSTATFLLTGGHLF